MAACPSCGTRVTAAPGEPTVCPACFTEFEAAAESTAQHARWDVLLVDGQRYDGLARHLVRERVYVGRIPIGAKVRPTGEQEWTGIHEVGEFMAIFALLGVEPPLASTVRRLAGWQRTAAPRPAAPPVRAEGIQPKLVAGKGVEASPPESAAIEPVMPVAPPAPPKATAKRAVSLVLLLVPVVFLGVVALAVVTWVVMRG